MKKPKATLKAYPIKEVQENMEHWADGQEIKRLTVRFVAPPTQWEMDSVYKKMVYLGFGSIDKFTFVQDVPVGTMGKIQKKLCDIFDLTYSVVSGRGKNGDE